MVSQMYVHILYKTKIIERVILKFYICTYKDIKNDFDR